MENNMTSETLSLILGLFLPPVVEYVKTKFANNKVVSYTITLVACVVIGVISTIIGGEFNTSNIDAILCSIGTSLLASQSVYNYYWKPKKLDVKFESYIAKIKL
jgi:predicted PurR-regulated permease PerM